MDRETLKAILDEHKLWIESCGAKGVRADLRGANLRGAKLFRADLCMADLSEANLSKADLSGSNLCRADLSGANLYRANLYRANLSEADLSEADLCRADLSGANLCRADLRGATNVPFIPMSCPDSGSFIGWKKASAYIVKLLIPEDARRSSSTGRKCRTDKATVLAIENIDGSTSELKEVHSTHDSNFIYRIGETVTVGNFDENRFAECAPGIHFFVNRQEAVEY